MQSQLSHYIMLVKRWIWVVVLGVVLCGGATYGVSKLIHPVYQASALVFLNLGSSNTTAFDNTSASLAALPTYAQLVTNPTVLKPVIARHKGLTLSQLNAMIAVKPQPNTQIIELDVQSTDPRLAAQLANEVGQSFAHYANTQLPAAVQILPAVQPTTPVGPSSLVDAGIGALVGLGLALALIVIFEWIDDRLASSEEVQEILGLDALTIIPRFSGKRRFMNAENTPVLAEGCRILCASLNAAQASKPFKLVMVTSALADEGKSTIAANLATFLAMTGKHVLLVDADLRRPVLDRHFELDNHQGLANALQEKWVRMEAELEGRPTEIPTLRVLTTGELPSNPTELLQSATAHQLFDYFEQSEQFDYVIFDTPPLLPVADAQILGSYVQATLLVIDASKTPRKVLLRARRVLNRTHSSIIGVVLNKSPWSDYAEIRQYLSDIRQSKADFDVTRPPSTPPVNDTDITIPTTPPTNGVVESDSEITMAISHGDKDSDE